MMPSEASQALRSSPRQSDDFGASLQRVFQAWRGSTQLMRPEVAIQKVNDCAEELFSTNFSISLEWLNNVNRYLWVLTAGTVVRLDSTSHQKMNRIWETVKGIYRNKHFSDVDPMLFAQQDPRKEDLSLKELLLQILGRCQLLEELFQTCASLVSSQATIKALKQQLATLDGDEASVRDQLERAQSSLNQLRRELAGTQEEENRLLSELGDQRDQIKQVQQLHEEKCEELLKGQLLLLAEKDSEIATGELVIKLLKRERDNLKVSIEQEEQRIIAMQDLLDEREETIQRLRRKIAAVKDDEKVREVEVVVGKDHSRRIQQLEKQNTRLAADIEFYENERAEAIAVFEKKPRVVVVEQDTDVQSEQLNRIREVLDRTVKQYDATAQTEPLRAAEALFNLMSDLQKILH